jgi:hypothetical protein
LTSSSSRPTTSASSTVATRTGQFSASTIEPYRARGGRRFAGYHVQPFG